MLLARHIILFALVYWFMPWGIASVFLVTQLAVFGVYMGASFAPNHKGMPIIGRDVKVDFLRRQVLTSRNITGGTAMDLAMGGLNYQIEHHLFPNMPRPALAKAAKMVKAYCLERSITYTETSLMRSYGIVVSYLNRVGLQARDPFDCPRLREPGAKSRSDATRTPASTARSVISRQSRPRPTSIQTCPPSERWNGPKRSSKKTRTLTPCQEP
jgi:fatty acid desaturase